MDITREENAGMNSVVVTVISAIKTTAESSNGTGQDGDEPQGIIYVIIVPVLFGLMTLIGTIGNSLVIYVILAERRMRTVTNILLLNLSLADLSFGLICPPFTAYELVTTDGWPFGVVVCKSMHYLLNVTAYVTVYTLVLISVTRYMTIVHNVRTARLRTRSNIVMMICAIWVVMLSVNVPIPIAYDLREMSGKIQCSHYEGFGRKLFATFFAFAYVLPLLVIAVLSISILLHIHKHRPSTISNKTKSQTKKRQASRLIILVVVIFALFWLPVHIHLLVAFFGNISKGAAYRTISLLWYVLAYSNSCANPIIYAFASQEFRDGFRRAIYCRRHKPSADDKLTAVSNFEPHNGANAELLHETKESVNNDKESTC